MKRDWERERERERGGQKWRETEKGDRNVKSFKVDLNF